MKEPTIIEEDHLPMSDRSCREHALDADDDEKFRRACVSNPKFAARWVFMYGCLAVFGMRVSEMTHLQLDWFDISKPGDECIRIPPKMKCNCYACIRPRKDNPNVARGYWTPKTRGSARVIPGRINIEAFWVIYSYLKEARTQMSMGEAKRDPVPRDRRRVWESIRRLGQKAGTKQSVFPHALRATAAMHIAALPNMTASNLMTTLGWNRLETANAYIRASGIELLRAFRPSEYELRREAESKEDEIVPELAPKGYERRVDAVTCTVCEAKVSLQGDGAWECQVCGAKSNIEG